MIHAVFMSCRKQPGFRRMARILAKFVVVRSVEHITGFAIRRRWPDGAHDFIKLGPTPRAAQDAIDADRRYWLRGPWRPVEYRVVAISRHDFDLHQRRRACKSPDCPG